MSKPCLNLLGQTYEYLTVIKNLGKRGKTNKTYWLCQCKCGNLHEASTGNLRSNQVMSCGCRRIEKAYRHGGKHEHLYGRFRAMHQRCNNPNNQVYNIYGGRGIKVCSEWSDYKIFRTWAQTNGYRKDLSIDRKNNNKNYSPDNCRWVTRTIQNRNKRKQLNVSSKYLGVYWNKTNKKWIAKITINNKAKYIGSFINEIDAAKAKDKYVIDNNLEGYILNFP